MAETLGEQYGPLLPSALRQSSARNRKNWLFARSDSGGEQPAVLYSQIDTCRLNNVEPEKWRKRTARTVLTSTGYLEGSMTRHGSSSLTRVTGQSAMMSRTWRR